MCDCINKVVTEDIKDLIVENGSDKKSIVIRETIRLNAVFDFSESRIKSFIPVVVFYNKEKVKTGERIKKDFEIQIKTSYCPFCGEKLKK